MSPAMQPMVLTRSHARGATDQPLIEQTIGAFDAVVEQAPEREALVVAHQQRRYTYRQLQTESLRLASALLRLGLQPGDRIGLWSHNNAERVLIQLATAYAGLVLVNINPASRTAEVEYALNKVGCQALVLMPCRKTSDYIGMLRELAPEWAHHAPGRLESARLPQLKHAIWIDVAGQGADEPGFMRFSELLNTGDASDPRLAQAARLLHPQDAINIQFTSGATGFPKGATLTHRNILNNGFSIGEAMKLAQEDRLCIPVPLYRCFGMALGNLACLTHGACIVYPNDAFEPLSVLETVQRDMHMNEVTIADGATEASPVSCQSHTDTPLDKRVSTVGLVQPYLEVKIIEPEAIDGEGWMHTGDLAPMDEEGYVNIVGRSKDLVIRGGENVYPREIEEFLYRHPKVQNVQVVGVPGQKFGEELRAWIAPKSGQSLSEDEGRDFCKGQIAHDKAPRYMRFVESFPMTVTGKIQKLKIRELMKQELGVEEAKIH